MNDQDQLKWYSVRGETTREMIGQVESQLGVKFPEDYIECALKNSGGHPSHDVYDIEGHDEIPFDRLLTFDPDDILYIMKTYRLIRDRLVDRVYPFATDDFGNCICFDYRTGNEPTIVFWDHEEAFLNKEKGLFPICNTFTELLAKLYRYEE